MGIHPHRRGVGDDLRVGVAVQIGIVVRAAAGDDSDMGAQLLQRGLYRNGRAAAAQHQRLLPGGRDPAAAHHVEKAVEIGVVAVQRAVRPADDGVDALQRRGRVRQFRAIGNHRFFIGDGDIQAVPAAGGQKAAQTLSGDFKEPVVVIAQLMVNHGGVAVAQRLAQQTAMQHQTTSL